MAIIKINDIFDELVEENKRLNESLNVLIKFKSFIDLVSNQLRNNLDLNSIQTFDKLHKEVNDVLNRTLINDNVNKNIESIDLNPDINPKKKIVEKKINSKVRLKGNRKSGSDETKLNIEYILDNNKQYICPFLGCEQRLKHRKSVRNHVRKHYGVPDQYKCDFDGCAFTTATKTRLIGHINNHKGIKPFVCEECGKDFALKQHLQSHIEHIHKVLDQTLVCRFDNCNKEFKTEITYQKHIKFHTKDNSFVCSEPNCSFKTIMPSLLRQHHFYHHSPERPHVCTVAGCSKSYKTAMDLRRHIKCHGTEREFKCQYEGCGKAFKLSNNLYQHLKLHNGIDLHCEWPGCDYKTKTKTRMDIHKVFHTSERNFPCNWPECNKRFKTQKDLIIHIRIHNNDKKYACSWPGCQYRCTDSGNLVKHRRVHIKA